MCCEWIFSKSFLHLFLELWAESVLNGLLFNIVRTLNIKRCLKSSAPLPWVHTLAFTTIQRIHNEFFQDFEGKRYSIRNGFSSP